MSAMNIYYVYFYLREDFTPYYIGKGKGKRAYTHHTNIKRPKNKSNIIIVSDNLTEIQSFMLERYYIQWFGRKNNETGILHNKTDGGEGTSGLKKDPWNKGKKTGQIPWNKGKTGIYEIQTINNMKIHGGHSKNKKWYNDGTKDYYLFPFEANLNLLDGRLFKPRKPKQEYTCIHCNKIIKGSGNLKQHLKTH